MTAEYKHEYMKFLSTPSARSETKKIRPRLAWLMISIHALREEGDSSI